MEETFLERALELCRGVDYADVRSITEESTKIVLKKGELEQLSSGTISAYAVRVLLKGAWGLASSNDPAALKEVAARAVKLARASSKRSMCSSLSEEKAHKKRFSFRAKQDARDIPLETKVATLRELDKEMRANGASSASIGYVDSTRDYWFASSEGTRLEFKAPTTFFRFEAFAQGKTLETAHRAMRNYAGFELEKQAHAAAVEVAKNAASMTKASRVPSGKYDVIVDSHMGTTMAHEAVGHACEADLILTGESILAGKIGNKVGNECVNIVDDGTTFPDCGAIPFDDEGVLSQRTQLIKDGVLAGYLYSRATAAKMNARSTGNARAESVSAFPIVRMTNTGFEPGDHSFDELVDVKRAVIIEGFNGGVMNPLTGEYQFAGETGWLVENGEKTKFLKSLSIAGNVLDTLKQIDALSSKAGEESVGMCGKSGQSVPVGGRAPWIRIRGARVLGK